MLVATLKRLRVERRMSQQAVARALNVSKSLIASFEQGRLIPQDDTAGALDRFLGSGDTIRKLSAAAHEDREHQRQQQPNWFRDWPDVERDALALRWHETSLIPGLLQTKRYAEMILGSGLLTRAQSDGYTATRMGRQAQYSTGRTFRSCSSRSMRRPCVGDTLR
ncbi:Scr1 family TA system antitoxin-like transcriptional regulator [Solwaraspora sp. WMMD1047]|uniref:Scr1 family TA system antitoxin-like transcriptional regulator n=1 Tax=Solwaraspora sp. WMMD1047 TaxID=3016102 RepID=UPI002416B42F|nr:Scr1 family TA system antitoxin-like transcriptional regulator [Solwaraspora sp. WMMD1047]MDG4831504.1 Scr1 family TA system antitoxin-like transcriptional regulator [Solwaraspora sp. WMMD1047]